MTRGNPNQKKVVEQLKAKGYDVKVFRNQIHIKGISCHPAFPDATIESGYRVPDGETIGLTVGWAKHILEHEIRQLPAVKS